MDLEIPLHRIVDQDALGKRGDRLCDIRHQRMQSELAGLWGALQRCYLRLF
jgi:hypothetical protein